MKKLLKALLQGALLAGLAVLLWVGYLIWTAIRQERAYATLVDTGDLGARIDREAEGYIKRRPNGRLVIGVFQNGRRRIRGYGDGRPPAAETPPGKEVFEIGSITKVFTGIALARLEVDGKVRLDGLLRDALPNDLVLPEKARAITLVQLATHTAGFPRLPANLFATAQDESNPYANYHEADLFAALRDLELDRPPGRKSSYSNFGMGTLGHVLARAAGQSYEELVTTLIAEPLGMSDTRMTLDADQRPRLVPGHDARGNVVANWDMDALAGAGGLRSTVDDLLRFVAANLAPDDGPLGKALALAQGPRFDSGSGDRVGLAWQLLRDPYSHRDVVWHNGGTGGYASFLGFDRAANLGIVALSSHGDAMAGDHSLDDIGLKVLREGSKVTLEQDE